MTPEQLARVVDAGRNVAGSEMHAVLDAMHGELMAIERDDAAEDLRKAPATDAGQPPEPGPFDRFIRGEFFNGPAHPDNEDFVAEGEPGHEQYVYSEGPLDDDVVDAVIHEAWCLGGHDEADPCPPMDELEAEAGLSDARLTPGERIARRRRSSDAPESVPPLTGMPGGYPTPDQQEALRRISEAVAAGGDVLVTDDKPDSDAPVHGLQETMFYQDNNPEETDKPVAAVQHTADGKNHRVVVWFGEDGAAADQFAAWFNTNRVDPVDELLGNGGTPVAATRPQPVYDALARNHAFDPDPEMAQFCKCGHSRYHDVHVLAK